jgi:phage-related baseplate assembly protein
MSSPTPKFDDAQVLSDDTRAFLGLLADALEHMREQVRAETRERVRPKADRAEVAPTNEALYRVGLKQFLATPGEAKTAPQATRSTNTIVSQDSSLKAALKASLNRAQSSFEQRRARGR